MIKNDSIVVLGPTAIGKTRLAVSLAELYSGEIVGVDSRQVYKGMDIGTGKDLSEYNTLDGKDIPYHLIDAIEVGNKYTVNQYYLDVYDALKEIQIKGAVPIFCGGSGLYLEMLLKYNEFSFIPVDLSSRKKCEEKSLAELQIDFQDIQESLRQKLDGSTIKRIIRAIEIADFLKENPLPNVPKIQISPLIIGLRMDRSLLKKRIDVRLDNRLDEGLIDEVEGLLDSGVSIEVLKYYGLEYKWVTLYLCNEISLKEMKEKLRVAIHQFSRRQMTWFRRMEKQGFQIHWIDGECSLEEQKGMVKKLWDNGIT